MLSSVTWAEYSVIILIALALYYIVIGIFFYKDKISTIGFKKGGEQQKNKLSRRSAEINEFEESSDTFFQKPSEHSNSEESKLMVEPELPISFNNFSQPELFTSHQNTPAIQQTDDTLQQVQELTAGLKEAIAQ